MSRRVASAERSGGESENYPTPGWAVQRILDGNALRPGGRWLEPCAGEGSIIRNVTVRYGELGAEVPIWSAVEMRPSCFDALEDLVAPEEMYTGDFLLHAPMLRARAQANGRRWFADVVLTNPPYTLAVPFINAARTLAPLVAMLLRLNFLESEERAPWFRAGNMPRDIYTLPNRPSFTLGKTDSCAYGWMLWDDEQHTTSVMHLLGSTPKAERARRAAPERSAAE